MARRLSEDASPLVRAEAQWYYQRMLLSEQGDSLTKAESRKKYKEIRRLFDPRVTFFGFRSRFWNQQDAPDYTIDELESFAQRFVPGDDVR